VVGSGAGGATIAKELQGTFDVTVLEAGGDFRPLPFDLQTIERMKRSRLLFAPGLIRVPFPPMRARRTQQGLVLVNGIGVGGTTTVATGNGLRIDDDLRAIGLDLDAEFDEIRHEIPVSTAHRRGWHATTRRLFGIFEEMGLDPEPMPKMGDPERCRHCGRCVLGCPEGVKWDARRFVEHAARLGARVITRSPVKRIVIESGAATGVIVRRGLRERFLPADLVVVAAGGLGTPAILERSGITCDPTLFVDPVLTVAGRRARAWQCKEIEMPFVAQRDGFILSPYFDYLSFLLEPSWEPPAHDLIGVMIKIADTNVGAVTTRGVEKGLTVRDVTRLEEGVGTCEEILRRLGVEDGRTFRGTLNAGHPGGTVPLTEADVQSMHPARLPENVYVADASLFPKALGNPPILTIVAMAKRIATVCAEHVTRPVHRPLPGEDKRSFMSRDDRPRSSPTAPSLLKGRPYP
jgi:choline dehydrogenase-like flavoprotein